MYWRYVAFSLGSLTSLGALILTMRFARDRRRLAREEGRKYFQGIGEIAAQAGFSGGFLLMAAANPIALGGLGMLPAIFTLPLALVAILILLFGVQLGRLLMRYQLRRLGTVVDTATGEVLTRSTAPGQFR